MSNQLARLVRDGVVRATKKEPGLLRVRPSTPETLYPDVYYSHRNEYNLLVQSKANPTFPNQFGIVAVRHSFPKNPSPLFKHVAFTIENRNPSLPNPSQVQSTLHGKYGAAYIDQFKDFHFLLYLSLQLPELAPKLAEIITKPSSVTEAEIKPTIDAFIKKALPSSSSSTAPQASSSNSMTGISPTASPSPSAASGVSTLSPKGQQIVKDLVAMGYGEKQASEAVWATGIAGLEQAVAFLLDG